MCRRDRTPSITAVVVPRLPLPLPLPLPPPPPPPSGFCPPLVSRWSMRASCVGHVICPFWPCAQPTHARRVLGGGGRPPNNSRQCQCACSTAAAVQSSRCSTCRRAVPVLAPKGRDRARQGRAGWIPVLSVSLSVPLSVSLSLSHSHLDGRWGDGRRRRPRPHLAVQPCSFWGSRSGGCWAGRTARCVSHRLASPALLSPYSAFVAQGLAALRSLRLRWTLCV